MTAKAILRQQNAENLERAKNAARALAENYPELNGHAEALTNARGRDHMHLEAVRIAALADLMEAIVEAVGAREEPGNLESLDEIGPELAERLGAEGFETLADLAEASDEDLLKVEGLGKAKLGKIRKQL